MASTESEVRTWGPSEAPTGASNVESGPLIAHQFTPTETFPEEWKKEFEGLLYLGYLEAEVKIPHHTWIVRTLLPAAKIELSMMLKDMESSIGYGRAYKVAICAAGVVSVDGRPIIVADKRESAIRQKYNYVANAWYDPIIDILYSAIDELEGKQLMVMRELGVIPDPQDQTE